MTERVNDGERKIRRKVQKVGIDPHFSFATMLCDIAYARAHGTATFVIPDSNLQQPTLAEFMDALPPEVAARLAHGEETCSRCRHYPISDLGPPKSAECPIIGMRTAAKNPGCGDYSASEGDDIA